jgi:DinB superfamily
MPLTAEVLDQRPAAGEWSVAELVGHLWDAEIAYGFRARIILTRDRAPLIGYDQEAWARLARPPLAELLAAFAALRTANLVLIRGTPVSLWDRLGIHEERAFAWPPRPSPAMTEPICCSSSRPSPRCRAELELPLHHPRPSGQGGVDRDNGGMA